MSSKIVNIVTAIIGGLMSYFYGEWSVLLQFLLLVVVMDYFTGILASVMEGKGLNSEVGFNGLARKGFIFLIIALLHRADIVLELSILMTGAIWFYIANELISITENYGRIGLPLPPQVKQIIAVLKQKKNSS